MGGTGRRTSAPGRSCLQSCVSILEFADNTERQLVEKLKRRGYGEDEIARAVARVKEKGLYSERAYALRFLRSAAKRFFGERRILLEMTKRGFSGENLAMAGEILRGEYPTSGGPFGDRDNSDIENLLSSLDFPRDCAILIARTVEGRGYPHLRDGYLRGGPPADRAARDAYFKEQRKLRAFLFRRGYSSAAVRAAEEDAGELLASSDEE